MIQDRVAGVLLGLATGDFHGGPIRMAVRLAESLSDCGRYNADDVLNRYLDWYRNGAFDTGPVAEEVFARLVDGQQVSVAVRSVHEKRNNMTAGCNPAHRCPPLAMSRAISDVALADVALREAALTHFDPLAGDVSAAVVVLCRALMIGQTWPDALKTAMVGRTDLTRRALSVIESESLDKGGYAPSALAAAIHFLDKYDGLLGALEASFSFAGHWNYCPVLVGAIGGARWGASAVPVDRVRHAKLLPRVRLAAERVAATW